MASMFSGEEAKMTWKSRCLAQVSRDVPGAENSSEITYSVVECVILAKICESFEFPFASIRSFETTSADDFAPFRGRSDSEVSIDGRSCQWRSVEPCVDASA